MEFDTIYERLNIISDTKYNEIIDFILNNKKDEIYICKNKSFDTFFIRDFKLYELAIIIEDMLNKNEDLIEEFYKL